MKLRLELEPESLNRISFNQIHPKLPEQQIARIWFKSQTCQTGFSGFKDPLFATQATSKKCIFPLVQCHLYVVHLTLP